MGKNDARVRVSTQAARHILRSIATRQDLPTDPAVYIKLHEMFSPKIKKIGR